MSQKPNRILNFSLVRLILGTLVSLLVYGISSLLAGKIGVAMHFSDVYADLLGAGLVAVLVPLAYVGLFYVIEKRSITEFSVRKMGKWLGLGWLIGAVLHSLVIGFIYVMGGYSINAVNGLLAMLPALAMGIASGVFEETLFRGVLFRIVEERLGSWVALILSALIFGFMHLMNDNSTFFCGLAIAIEAGLMLGAAYMVTRSLWFPIAIHFAWNFMQGGFFGAPVSGLPVGDSLFESTIKGATWYSGGAFGPEASLQAIVFCSVATFVMIWMCYRRGLMVKGALWERRGK